MGWWSDAKDGAIKFLTGHDAKAERKVIKKGKQIKTVIKSLKGISSEEVSKVKEDVREAMQKLQSAKGIEYVATIEPGYFDELYDSAASSISELSGKFSASYDAIKKYSEASTGEKILASTLMAGSKFGEGLLSVPEELGDGALSIVGWGAGALGFKGAQEEIGKFVEKDWAHTAFDKLYYSTDLAKKSAFTEDSAISGAFKIGGKAVGYLYAGGAATRLGGNLLNASSKGGKLLQLTSKGGGKLLHLASGSTWGATATAGLGGIGSGTQNGLKAGLSYDDAFKQGLKDGRNQAIFAFAAGKLGEKVGKAKEIKKAKENLKNADDMANGAKANSEIARRNANADASKTSRLKHKFEEAQKAVDDIKTSGDYKGAVEKIKARDAAKKAYESSKEALKDSREAYKTAKETAKNLATKRDIAEKVVKTAKDSKWYNYEGYDDAITQAGRKGHPISTIKNAITKPKVPTELKPTTPTTAAPSLKTTVTEAAKKTISTGGKVLKNGGKAVIAVPKAAITHPAQTGTVVREGIKEVGKAGAERQAEINSLIPKGPKKSGLTPSTPEPTSMSKFTPKPSKPEPIPDKPTPKPDKPTPKPDKPTPKPDEPTPDGYYPRNNGGGGGGGGGGNGGSSSGSKGIAYKDPVANTPKAVEGTIDNIPSNAPTTQSVAKTPTDGIKPVTPTPESTTEARQEITTPASTTNTDTGTDTGSNITTTTGPSSVVSGSETVGTPSGGASAYHTGGGYSESDGFTGTDTVDTPTEIDTEIEDILSDTTDSIDDIIKGNKYTKIPTSSTPITHPSSGSTGSAVIPIAAGLSAAAAAGIGAKAYMDHKKNNDNDDDDDDFTEEWDGDENSIEVDYDNNESQENYLDEDDNYGYQETEKYDAKNNEELADLQ